MQLILRPHLLKLEHTFTISRQSFDTKPTLIVELKDDEISGYGEASSNPYYHITIEKMVEDLEKIQPLISTYAEDTPEVFWQKMHSKLNHNMFALCALDMAFHDLYARKKEKKLYELWGFDISKNPLTNYTIGIDTIENMVLKMKEKPWPIYKIKLGTKEDLKIVKALRKQSNAIFRIDANCAWSVQETIENSMELKKLGVEFIEQPLPANDWLGAKEVYHNSALPIIADESCQVEEDVQKCFGYFHGVNIKLPKCGGLTPAKRMIAVAKSKNMKTMVGCMTESSVGISAIAHLLPHLDYVDMDGAMLLKNDLATGVKIKNGIIEYPNLNGIGVKLNT